MSGKDVYYHPSSGDYTRQLAANAARADGDDEAAQHAQEAEMRALERERARSAMMGKWCARHSPMHIRLRASREHCATALHSSRQRCVTTLHSPRQRSVVHSAMHARSPIALLHAGSTAQEPHAGSTAQERRLRGICAGGA